MSIDEEKSTRQSILEAAEREFLTLGFAAAKTKDIAAAAGVTHAMLHYYFGTKEGLFNKVFDEKLKVMGQSVLSLFTASDIPFLDRVKKGVEAHFDFIRSNPYLPNFVITQMLATPERREYIADTFKSLGVPIINNLQKAIDAEVERGNVNPVSGVDLMIDIMSLNLWTFIILPMSEPFRQSMYGSVDEFLDARRRENVEVIMKRLNKQ